MTLAWVIRGVQGLLGGWHLKGLMSQALAFLVYRRMSEINAKMGRLAARFASGGLFCRVPRLVRVARVVVAPVNDGPRVRVARIWPGRVGWMVRLGGWQAAGVGLQLRGWLEQPETVELLIAAPQAARILRPLCRMLMIETSLLRPRVAGDPVAAEVAPVVREVRKRVRKKRPPIDWGRIPLPRGVLSWARREGFGKLPRGSA